MTKVAVVAFYGAFPPVSGAAAVTFNLAKFLSADTLLIEGGDCAGSFVADGVHVTSVPGSAKGKVLKLAGFPARLRAIVAEVRKFSPDIVVLEGASWVGYHWMLLRAIRRALPRVRVIYHSHNVEYLLRRNRNGRAIAALTRIAESRVVRGADLSTAVSCVDQEHFVALYGVRPVILPNGVDLDRFGAVRPEDIERVRMRYSIGDCAVIFSGLYAYPPNREAVDFLRRDVMPIVMRRNSEAQLVVTGAEIHHAEPWLVASGIVPHMELPAVIAACRVAAAPVFSGSGTRLKILEAMAAGVPVVATAKGAEGLPLRGGEHLLLADTPEPFAGAIGQILESPALAQRIRMSARQLVNSEFDWANIAADAGRVLGNCSGMARELAQIPNRAALE